MYYELSRQFRQVAQYLHLQEVCIDNLVFKLHYVGSVVLFVVYSLLVTISTYAGDPIDCLTHDHEKQDGSDLGDYLDWYSYTPTHTIYLFDSD